MLSAPDRKGKGEESGDLCCCTQAVASRLGGSPIKALIADSPIHDIYALSIAEFPLALLKAPAFVTKLLGQLAMHHNTTDAATAERSAWQFGVSNLSQLVELEREQVVKAEIIHCPTRCLTSEGDAPAFLTQAHEFYNALNVPKKLHIFSAESGADAHCQVNNLTLMQEIVYDWLDEMFDGRIYLKTVV